MSKPLVILGTARRDGETRRAIDIAFPSGSIDLAILSEHYIVSYDYAHATAGDDFLNIVEKMLIAKAIVFATPVYWYAMSAPMKIFFDRMADLMQTAKEKGRALAGKNIWLLSTGEEVLLPDGFEVPFARTAQYFDIHYRGAGYLYTGSDPESRKHSETALVAFGAKILGA